MNGDVVIAGRGVVTASGIGLGPLWAAQLAGHPNLQAETLLSLRDMPVGGTTGRFREEDLQALRQRHSGSDAQRLAREVVSQALDEASLKNLDDAPTALFLTQLPDSGYEFDERPSYADLLRQALAAGAASRTAQVEYYAAYPPPKRASLDPGFLQELLSRIKRPAPVISLQATCATGLRLVTEAARWIRTGKAARAIVFAVSRPVDAVHLAAFARALAVSRWQGAPPAASRPFDAQRTGFVLAEGAGALVLESAELCARRGAKPLAKVSGFGLAMSAQEPFRPNRALMAQVMNGALSSAGLPTTAIDVISSMGAATILGDSAEVRAIHKVFAERAATLPVTAEKAVMGYMVQAATLVEICLCLEMMRTGLIPPVPTCEVQGEELELSLARTVRQKVVKTVLKNAFGMGGHYGSLALQSLE